MKNTKEMTSLFFTVSGRNGMSMTSTKGTLFIAIVALLVVGAALPSEARAKKPAETQGSGVRELPWASDGNYSAVEIQSACQATDEKHATWQTDVRNTTDSPIQLKVGGKNLEVDANTSVQLDPIAAKNCQKALRLKLDARAAGDRDHFALDYNDGVIKAHHKSPTDWMGMTAAIMAGVSAGLGSPIPMPDPPAADQGDSSDDDQ